MSNPTSQLAWSGSHKAVRTPSPLQAGVSGRIVYREPSSQQARPAELACPSAPKEPRGSLSGFSRAGRIRQPQTAGKRKSLYLRSGDVIPSEVTSIDENGVHFRTALSASTFVAHDKVKAVELALPGERAIKLTSPSAIDC